MKIDKIKKLEAIQNKMKNGDYSDTDYIISQFLQLNLRMIPVDTEYPIKQENKLIEKG